MHIGIDPGLNGAVAVFTDAGELVSVSPMPTMPVTASRTEIDIVAVSKTLRCLLVGKNPQRVTIEHVGTHPTWSVQPAFNFGDTFGQLKAMCRLNGWPLLLVKPQIWKAAMLAGTDKSKEAAIAKAKGLFPNVSLVPPGKRKESDDFAEAVLIGLYGVKHA